MSSAMSEQERCIFCLTHLHSMSDPRKLPCSHVFCHNCLEANPHKDEIECLVCRQFHNGAKAADLPKVQMPGTVDTHTVTVEDNQQLDENLPNLTCDRCDGQTAVCYCLDCGDKICGTHLEYHKGYYGNDHQTVDIKLYQSRPHFYIKPRCKLHTKKPISMICQRCYKQSCSQCKSEDNCGIKPGASHVFKSLEDIRQEIVDQFEEMLKVTEQKMSKLCRDEKATWNKVDEEAVFFRNMADKVDMLANQEIAKINQMAENVKRQIKQHTERRKKHIEEFIAKIHNQMEILTNTRSEIRRLLADYHVTELVQLRDDKLVELTEVNDTKPGYCEWPKMMLTYTGLNTGSLELKTIPKLSLQHQIEHDGFYQLHLLTPKQVLIVDLQDTVRCLEMSGKEIWSGGTPFTDLACRGQKIYYVSDVLGDENIYCTHLTNFRQAVQDKKDRKILRGYPSTNHYDTNYILADENHLIVISVHVEDEASPPIFHIYHFALKTWWKGHTAKSQLHRACLHADGDMLVLWTNNTLQKLKLDGDNQMLTEQWSCTNLMGSFSVCSALGITYVGALNCIYVISMFGELVGKIPINTHAEFLEIQDDVLAVGGEDNIDIYKIKF